MMTRKRNSVSCAITSFSRSPCLFGSIGWVVFLLPNHITLGGLPGISSIPLLGFGIPVPGHLSGAQRGAAGVCAAHSPDSNSASRPSMPCSCFTACVSVLQSLTAGSHLLHDQPFMATVVGACFLGGVGNGTLVQRKHGRVGCHRGDDQQVS